MVCRRAPSDRLICKIDVTGFVGVMLVLIVIMTPVGGHGGRIWAGVHVPTAAHAVLMPEAEQEGAMVISIARDGRIYIGPDRVWGSELPQTIRDRVSRVAEPKVYLVVDRRARYGAVLGVLEVLPSCGVERVAFVTDPRGKLGPTYP